MWNRYLELEKEGLRSAYIDQLAKFIDSITEKLSEEDRHRWARGIAKQVVDQGVDIPVRFPLFRELIFPALRVGIENTQPGCARWLAGFFGLLHHCGDEIEELSIELRSRKGLLRLALEQDPEDSLALESLVSLEADEFEYALHELPSAVLCGANGATTDECAEMLADIQVFRQYCERLELDKYDDLIEECSEHFELYPQFLRQRVDFDHYDEFLKSRSGSLPSTDE